MDSLASPPSSQPSSQQQQTNVPVTSSSVSIPSTPLKPIVQTMPLVQSPLTPASGYSTFPFSPMQSSISNNTPSKPVKSSAPAIPSRFKRMEGQVVIKPIVLGTVARPIPNKLTEEGMQLFNWTCYVRPFLPSQDLSFIKKVVFHTHPSFEKPIQEVVIPPFEISENGWGEFTLEIDIHFLESNEDGPLRLEKTLRLYHDEDGTVDLVVPVVDEVYDELIFVDPTEHFYQILNQSKPEKASQYIVSVQALIDQDPNKFDENEELALLAKVQQELDADIASLQQSKENQDVVMEQG